MAVLCGTTGGGTEQIRACVSRYDQSVCSANWWRSSAWCAYCKHRCAAVLAHTQVCHIKNQNGKLVMHQSQLNQASWNRAVLKFDLENQLTVNPFSWFLPWLHDLDKVTPLSSWLGMRRKGPWCWRMWELLAFEHVKTMVDKKTRFEKLNPCSTC